MIMNSNSSILTTAWPLGLWGNCQGMGGGGGVKSLREEKKEALDSTLIFLSRLRSRFISRDFRIARKIPQRASS